MIRVLSGAAILALAATAASAADLGVAPPAPAPVLFTWTGCHLGGHVGGLFSDEVHTNIAGISSDHDTTPSLAAARPAATTSSRRAGWSARKAGWPGAA